MARSPDSFVTIASVDNSLTITEFLNQTGAHVHVFDMGRRVIELDPAQVQSFEQTEIPYPLPFLRNAWLGILFLHEGDDNRPPSDHIWFLKLPLDEQGLLQLAARDDVLRRIAETLTQDNSALSDNPFGFKPREDRMATFHARASRLQGTPPSQYFAHAVDYFCGRTGFDQWQFVGLQGIAEVAARRDEVHHGIKLDEALARAIPELPEPPFCALCSCLENEAINPNLSLALSLRLRRDLARQYNASVAAAIRALSLSTDHVILHESVQLVLDSESGNDVEILAAISGRAWETLDSSELRTRFLEQLARCGAGQQAFDGLLADLLFMPGLRESLLQDFRNPDRSETLSQAIGRFLQQLQQGQPEETPAS